VRADERRIGVAGPDEVAQVIAHLASGRSTVCDVPRARVRAPQALFISGTVGAGKTSTAGAVGDRLQERGVPGAVIDLDWLRCCWPSSPGDPFNNAVELTNLAAVARTYLRAGAERLVLAGVLEVPAARAAYEDAVGAPLQVCRLHVDLAVVRRRLQRRHQGEEGALQWHLDRSGELDAVLRAAHAEQFTVDATALTLRETAAAVVHGAGWDEDPPSP